MADDEDLRREVRRLREDVDSLRRRLESLERAVERDATDPSGESEPIGSIERDETVESDAITPSDAESAAVSEGGREEPADPSGRESTTDSADSTSTRDWELAVGVRWLGLAGAAALVIGVAFFVQLAIEIGLLGPLGRVAVGAAGGLALFAGGRYAATRKGYVRWGRIAAGAGLAVAYFSIYASYGFESYREAIGTPLWVVLAALTALVGATAVVSVRDRAPLVVGEAFLLGYVTAAISTDAATLVATPAYVLLLAGGLVAVASVTRWSRPVLSSTFASYGVLLLWLADVDPPAAAIAVVSVATLVVYLAGSYVLRGASADRLETRRYRAQLVAITAVAAGFGVVLLEIAVRDWNADAAGLGPAVVAVLLAGTYAVTDRRPVRPDGTAAAGTVVFLALGVAMAVGTFATTVGALALVCLGVAAAKTLEEPGFRFGSHVVAGATTLKLLAVDASELPAFDAAEPVATLTGRPVAFALAVAVFYGLAWWVASRPTVGDDSRYVPPLEGVYATVATGLAVVVLALEFSGVGVSIAWILLGLALLAVGFVLEVRGLRALAIGVFGLATTKVFLLDTRDLDTVARTLSFLVLGVVLLIASYAYARSRSDVSVTPNAVSDALGIGSDGPTPEGDPGGSDDEN
ncbi:hypothetical protein CHINAEXTREME_08710 [Halobiforma lacisalsi AJ5]|uniref:DUF2339 domain-containing protein n=1 Tax=Natronobacterium lacisalsi AJ5 TaxID=358396 RepID=M0L7Q7_NATLA|nr:DUF2339 domain-containing protein [Halobiforma lacisalsi]APW97856.1 hypothetical protein CHINAEXTREME_08710 [Halobiforma lacisalsi AJ5]EMA29123.1 hypothetical protein C445_17284 [Halobiforma lacisalsi AJ5]